MSKKTGLILSIITITLTILLACLSSKNDLTGTVLPTKESLSQITPDLTTELPTHIPSTATIESTAIPSIETPLPPTAKGGFSGERAYQDIEFQMDLGPRTPDSSAHNQTIDYIKQQLTDAGWVVQQQEMTIKGKTVKNIIAYRDIDHKDEEAEWTILGTHYDTRLIADRDLDEKRRSQPVPGANDGASGVAVLLELARVLPEDLDKNIWLVFFDAEDNGRIQGWDWVLGSRAFVDSLNSTPDAALIIDMVGDEDLDIYIEKNSDKDLVTSIWSTASSLGYKQYFIPVAKRSILDDHTPFIEKLIPAALIIDLDYAFWHTTQDTIDKVSANSLQIVGDVVYTWVTSSE